MCVAVAVGTVLQGGMSLGKGGEAVRTTTLDSYNLTGVSLLKIDVQGAEQLAVYGARVSESAAEWVTTRRRDTHASSIAVTVCGRLLCVYAC